MNPLRHHHDDTFTSFFPSDEQIKCCRFIVYGPAFYFITVRSEGNQA
jgi:hypothetical protein